ncbi:MAG: hypothetical protein PVG63_08915 [Anaerolineales bacterium]|jgi:hypothetical protein
MIEIDALQDGYALNLRLVQKYTQDLTHHQSLIQPEFEANCLNWVLGHMAVNRGRVLDLLGYPRVLGAEEKEIYESGSPPILEDGPGVIQLPGLIDLLGQAQSVLASAIESTPTSRWNQIIQVDEHEMTVARRAFGFYFHETFHTGQVEILAALSRGR